MRKQFLDYCLNKGMDKTLFLNKDNLERYAETTSSGYNGYPLFDYSFHNKFNENECYKMLKVDFKSRLGKTIGIATPNYESILMIEAPLTKLTGAWQYVRSVNLSNFYLLFTPTTNRQNAFEKYALKQREEYLDANTWYLYIFVTKKRTSKKWVWQAINIFSNILC